MKRCHLCNIPIYPGEKRCLIAIHIFPDQEEDIFLDDVCTEDQCPFEDFEEDFCDCDEMETQGEVFREAHLVLCKDCQEQFLKNPFIKENLFFLRREVETKTVH